MRETFIGFDSAWADKTPGGICWVTFVNKRLEEICEPQPATFEEAAQITEERWDSSDYTLVALDQPTLVSNKTGSRPVEKVAASLISRLQGGVQPANQSKESMFGPKAPVWAFLDRLNARENPSVARTADDGLYLIEVFPALALPALEPCILKRKRKASYNPDKKAKFSRSDWDLVTEAVRRHADTFNLAPLSRWANEKAKLDTPTKSDQDCLDAAICLIIALLWRREKRELMAVIGDGQNGYMVTPVSSEGKKILKQAADVKNVPMDKPWFRDAERTINKHGPV